MYDMLLTEGQQLRYCGVGSKFEEVIIQGNPDDLKVCDFIHLDTMNIEMNIAYSLLHITSKTIILLQWPGANFTTAH